MPESLGFHLTIEESLADPIAWMEMARTLRRAADLIETQVIKAAWWQFEQSPVWDDEEDTVAVASPSEQDRQLALNYRADEKMARVGQMLYQMSYENAAKGVIKLKSVDFKPTHNLTELFDTAKIELPEEIDWRHLTFLSRMNELGRYNLTRKGEYQTAWTTQFRERRAKIDNAIAVAWLANGGAFRVADITDIDEV